MRGRLPRVGLAAIATAVVLAHAGVVAGPGAGQVTGLTADQGDGFATLSWTPVPGATDYQIERTPVDAANEPTGPATIVGLWQPTRTVTPTHRRSPTPASCSANASAGASGRGSGRWRSRSRRRSSGRRARSSAVGPGAKLRTQFEQTNGAAYTSDVNEYLYTAALDAASERVRVVEIGARCWAGPINMFIFGHPEPLQSAAEISKSPTTLIQCHVHGDEPSMRESCLILARELAFTDDPQLLEHHGALDGADRSHAQRRRPRRQHARQLDGSGPQPRPLAASRAGDEGAFRRCSATTRRTSRSTVTTATTRICRFSGPPPQRLRGALLRGQERPDRELDLRQRRAGRLVRGPYSNGGASQETILRNTFGLKSIVGILSENRPNAGATRPSATFAGNENREVVRPALARQAGARIPLRQPLHDPAFGRGVARVPESQRRPGRVPRLVPVAAVPAAAEHTRRRRSGAGRDPRGSPVRLLPHRRAVHGSAAGRHRGATPEPARHRRAARTRVPRPHSRARLLRPDDPAPARARSDAPRPAGGRADGRRRATAGGELVAATRAALRWFPLRSRPRSGPLD